MISVVMPSYLGDYPNAASNREEKLPRAIESFLAQGIGELIVVADGCEKTAEIASKYPVKLISIDKQPHFSGTPRNIGIENAQYDYITYLDNDDVFGNGHLKAIVDNRDWPWLYWADKIGGEEHRDVKLECGHIGTSCFAHKKDLPIKWVDGYIGDWNVVSQLIKFAKGNKIEANYHTMHIPHRIDK